MTFNIPQTQNETFVATFQVSAILLLRCSKCKKKVFGIPKEKKALATNATYCSRKQKGIIDTWFSVEKLPVLTLSAER
jgi:hypothetical protein